MSLCYTCCKCNAPYSDLSCKQNTPVLFYSLYVFKVARLKKYNYKVMRDATESEVSSPSFRLEVSSLFSKISSSTFTAYCQNMMKWNLKLKHDLSTEPLWASNSLMERKSFADFFESYTRFWLWIHEGKKSLRHPSGWKVEVPAVNRRIPCLTAAGNFVFSLHFLSSLYHQK